MEGKWTKGEWTSDGPDYFGDWNIHHTADSLAVAAVVCDPLPSAPTMVAAVVTNLRAPEEVAANARLIAQAPAMAEALEKLLPLLRLLTVRQVIEAGDEAIAAAGLNPWCINEGLATGDERISAWSVEALLTAIKGE